MIPSRRQCLALSLLLVCLSIARNNANAQLKPSASPPTCRDAAIVDSRETQQINAHLNNLLADSTFFAVFSVALDKQCPFWDDDAQCVIRECSVCHCEDNEIPPAWLRDNASEGDCRDGQTCIQTTNKLNNVDRSLTGLAALVDQPVWHTADSDRWTVRDEESEMVYVDLRKNPEQYTGYSGPSARKIWGAVYDENCFMFFGKCRSGICDPDTCKEERVLYRLISGLHASISMHIAKRYLVGERWGVNTSIYKERLREHPERIANLHLAYAVVLRAVSKASAALHPDSYSYITGNDENDDFTKQGVIKLFELPTLRPGCDDKVFDESDMFIKSNEYLLPEFRNAFRNISSIMDCVGCEKCRVWGKLQFLGLGTALRILFANETPELERNELIALINLLHKLSTSVLWVGKMEELLQRDARIMAKGGSILAVAAIILLALSLRPQSKSKSNSKEQAQKDASNKGESTIANASESSVDQAKDAKTGIHQEKHEKPE